MRCRCQPFELWEDHAAAFEGFLAVSDQWRVASVGMAGAVYIGLDNAGARVGLEMAGISLTPDQWAALRVIASGAVAKLNDR